MLKWVVRLACVAGIFGVIGSVAIVLQMTGNGVTRQKSKGTTDRKSGTLPGNKVEPTKNPQQPRNTFDVIETDTFPDSTRAPSAKVSANETPTTAKKDTVSVPSEAEKSLLKKRAERGISKEKVFSHRELKGLLKSINKAMVRHSLHLKCVQLHKTLQGNNKKGSVQLERYLKLHKFSIAGRETVAKSIDGIKITPFGECLRVTIGKF